MELNDVLKVIRDQRRLIAGLVLAAIAVAGLLSWSAVRLYSSSTQLFVSVAGSRNATDPYNNDLFSQQRAVSYVQILTGVQLAQRVVDELRLPMTATALAAEVTAAPLPSTVILQVSVTDPSPERAQAIAASVGRQFTRQVAELETPDGSTTPNVSVRTIQAPGINRTPVSPNVPRNLVLGAALGLVLAVAAALIRSRMDRTVRDDEGVREASGVEVIGKVVEDRALSARHVSSGLGGQSPTAEAYRTIRVNLQHVDEVTPPQVIVVTSALPGEGTSTVAVNLAVSLARSGSRVLLVDGNLRRPRVARYLGLDEDGPGLTDVLAGTAELRDALQPWGDGTLTVLGAGPLPSDPDDMLGSARMGAFLTVLRDSQQFVVIDSPPLLSVVDGAVLSALADGCVIVTRAGKTKRENLAEAVAAVQRVNANLFGVVLNRLPRTTAAASASGRRSYHADPGRRQVSPGDVGPPPPGDRPQPLAADPVPASRPGQE